jgi:hypothetical protein
MWEFIVRIAGCLAGVNWRVRKQTRINRVFLARLKGCSAVLYFTSVRSTNAIAATISRFVFAIVL